MYVSNENQKDLEFNLYEKNAKDLVILTFLFHFLCTVEKQLFLIRKYFNDSLIWNFNDSVWKQQDGIKMEIDFRENIGLRINEVLSLLK